MSFYCWVIEVSNKIKEKSSLSHIWLVKIFCYLCIFFYFLDDVLMHRSLNLIKSTLYTLNYICYISELYFWWRLGQLPYTFYLTRLCIWFILIYLTLVRYLEMLSIRFVALYFVLLLYIYYIHKFYKPKILLFLLIYKNIFPSSLSLHLTFVRDQC